MKQLKIGRAQHCDIVINDTTVSSEHLEVFKDDEGNVFITDLNSSNGTFVNGKRITGSEKLNQNDIVKVGNSVLPWRNYLKEGYQQTAILEAEKVKQPNEPTKNKVEYRQQTIVIKEKSHFLRNLFFIVIGIALLGGLIFLILPEDVKRDLYQNMGIENSDFVRGNSLKSYVQVENFIENNTLGRKLSVKTMLFNEHRTATIHSVTLRYNFSDGSEDRRISVNIPPQNTLPRITNEKFNGRRKNTLRSVEVVSASE
jgi:hypothetical protein